jgi:hypothetical protein
MAAKPRSAIVTEGEVQVFHCHARCVRRAFLTGFDRLTQTDYSYRREWIVGIEQEMATLFGLDIGFHTEMSNHYHLVLRSRPDVVEQWSDERVVRNALRINLIKRHGSLDHADVSEKRVRAMLRAHQKVGEMRTKLASVSWFMASLNETIARRANREDGVSGCFFESRFQCQRLEDETSLLICGMYIDLNQIRAGETVTPEESTHTSAYDRIESERQQQAAESAPLVDRWMAPLTLDPTKPSDPLVSQTRWRASDKGLLSMTLKTYLCLLDWTGRAIRKDKRGSIPAQLKPILERLGFPLESLVETVRSFGELTCSVLSWSAPGSTPPPQAV